MVITKGCTRLVIILDKVVIKIPNPTYQWDHFLKGIIANINESKTWKTICKYNADKKDLLCPVRWCSWGGWLLVMDRADTDRHEKEVYEDGKVYCYAACINAGLGGDDKPDNYGYIGDRLVKIDYGN